MPPGQPAAPAVPTLTAVVAATTALPLAPLRSALDREVAAWAKAQHYQATVTLEVVGYASQLGTVPTARARVRVKIDNGSGVRFNRIVRTDTVVGDRGRRRKSSRHAQHARCSRSCVPQLRRTMATAR